jgi:hypothetical protein
MCGASPFLLNLIKECEVFSKAYFLIVGDGTDYPILLSWFNDNLIPELMNAFILSSHASKLLVLLTQGRQIDVGKMLHLL